MFRLVDWLVASPEELEKRFRDEVRKFEEDLSMPYVTSIDRLGREDGRREGLLKRQLKRRFDQLPAWGLEQTSQAEMERWTDQILDANALRTS